MPSYLFGRWLEVEGRLRSALGVFLMFDYDGTLTHIASRPEEAKLSPEVRGLLKSLATEARWVKVAVVSGRTVRQLKELVGVDGLFYAGLHGLVIEGPGLSFIHREAARLRGLVRRLKGELEESVKGFQGVLLEDKGLSVAVHYRLAPQGTGRALIKALAPILSKYEGFRTLRGKKVVEILPDVDWDKGRAALMLLSATRSEDFVPVYVGDDETDEHAFRALSARGVTVAVGRKQRSYAKFYVKSVEEVHELLRRILKLASL